jgi:hypothetical protein
MWEDYDPPVNKPPFTPDAAAIKKGNKIYKMGGDSYQSNKNMADFVITDAVWTYNCETNIWEQEAGMPFELMNAAAIYDPVNDIIKVYGGVKADGSFNNEVLVYNLGGTSINNNFVSVNGNVLGQNFPNPFSSSTTIAYTLSSASEVNITIYNMHGKEIEVLLSKWQEAGKYTLNWSPNYQNRDNIYFLSFKTNDGILTRKIVLQR